MGNYRACIFIAAMIVSAVNYRAAASFLQAQQFPKTFNDLSFVDRIAVLAEGYSPWETTYDENGNCISGCAYKGMTIQDEIDAIEENTRMAVKNLNGQYQRAPEVGIPAVTIDESTTTPAPTTGTATSYTPPTPTTQQPPIVATQQNAQSGCPNRSTYIPLGLKVPTVAPLDGDLIVTSDFGPRKVTRGSTNHKGLDFRAATGTNVYSPADGVVVNVWNDTQYGGGLSIKIRHSDGYETSYCHLSQQLVKPGDTIGAGCLIAKTGNTGTSSGPHLHYGIKYNNQFIDPLWTNNYLGRTYKMKDGARSTLHQGRKLPGEI